LAETLAEPPKAKSTNELEAPIVQNRVLLSCRRYLTDTSLVELDTTRDTDNTSATGSTTGN